jgi:hypothetical protein
MKYILIIAFQLACSIASASACFLTIDKEKPIDRTVSKSIDVDGDGNADNIVLHMQGKNFRSPFKWELKIYSKTKIIYHRTGSNEKIETFFSDPDYIGDCSGYDDCKCKWYFHDFLERIIVRMSADNVGVFDKTAPNSIYVVAKQALKNEYKKNPALVDKAIQNAADRLLSGKAVAIVIPDEPEIATPPMVWMPEFKRFVPIYED